MKLQRGIVYRIKLFMVKGKQSVTWWREADNIPKAAHVKDGYSVYKLQHQSATDNVLNYVKQHCILFIHL